MIEIPGSNTNSPSKKRTRTVDNRQANHSSELGRWSGKAPTEWTRQRASEIKARSKAARRVEPTKSINGQWFAERVIAGKLYAYPLEQRKRDVQAMPPGATWKLGDKHRRAFALVVTAHLSLDSDGLVISHATMAPLVGCGERTCGTVMRELCAWNLLESHARYRDKANAPGQHERTANRYTVTEFGVAFFDLAPYRGRGSGGSGSAPSVAIGTSVAPLPGKSCQAKRSFPTERTPEKSTDRADAASSAAEGSVPEARPLAAPVPVESFEHGSDATSVKTRPDALQRAPEGVMRTNGPVTRNASKRVRNEPPKTFAETASALLKHFGELDDDARAALALLCPGGDA